MTKKIKESKANVRTLRDVKGITLIALVITVVVMLILAGVTINLTLGQERHIHHSPKSSTKLYTGTKSRDGRNRGFYKYSR